jgi:hypothetical protein
MWGMKVIGKIGLPNDDYKDGMCTNFNESRW